MSYQPEVGIKSPSTIDDFNVSTKPNNYHLKEDVQARTSEYPHAKERT
jgi:hypothetical protein